MVHLRDMVHGGTEWSIHNWLTFVICINKLALKIMKKTK